MRMKFISVNQSDFKIVYPSQQMSLIELYIDINQNDIIAAFSNIMMTNNYGNNVFVDVMIVTSRNEKVL